MKHIFNSIKLIMKFRRNYSFQNTRYCVFYLFQEYTDIYLAYLYEYVLQYIYLVLSSELIPYNLLYFLSALSIDNINIIF